MSASRLREISDRLVEGLSRLSFGPPVTCVYNPLEYARVPWDLYLERYGGATGRVLLVGMNPGPWGMAQTGVPFGDVTMVRDWLHMEAPIGKPASEHPQRPIEGLQCWRGEISGQRLYGWARQRYGSADAFFRKFFIANYCPLCFLEESGKNRTPDKLPRAEQKPLYEVCDQALRDTVLTLKPSHVVGIGQFAEERSRLALEGMGLPIGRIHHPSPASPIANRQWAQDIEAQLLGMGIRVP